MNVKVGNIVTITGKHMYCSNKYKFRVVSINNDTAEVELLRKTDKTVILKEIPVERLKFIAEA